MRTIIRLGINRPQPIRSASPVLIRAAAMVILLLSGCTVGPDYHQPEIATPANWSEPAPAAVAAADQPPDENTQSVLADWWKSFHDPILDDLIHQAIRANTDLRTAVERLRESRAQRGVISARYLPVIDADSSYSYSRLSEHGFLQSLAGGGSSGGGGGGLQSSVFPGAELNLNQIGLDSSWELDIFGANRRALESADAEIQAAVLSIADVQVSLSAEVAQDYVMLRSLQARHRIALETVNSETSTVDIVAEKVHAGVASSLDLSRARTLLATSSARLPQIDAAIRAQIHLIETLLDLMPGTLVQQLDEVAPLPAPPATFSVGIPSDVIRRRPDVRIAERRLASATARIGVATADLFPRFSLTGSFGFQAQELGDLPEAASQFWVVGPAVRWPLLDWGRIRSNIDVQDSRARQAEIAYEASAMHAFSDVEIALVRLAGEKKRTGDLQRAVDAASASVQQAQDLYRNGVIEFSDLLDTQRTLYGAQDARAVGQASVALDTITLFKALGGGWGSPDHPQQQKQEPTTSTLTATLSDHPLRPR